MKRENKLPQMEEGTAGESEGNAGTEGSAAGKTAGREVSTQDLNLRGGTDKKNLRLIDKRDWKPEWRKAEESAKKRGLTLEVVTGGYIETVAETEDGKKLVKARALIDGKRVIVRGDDPMFSADQILEHEMGHDKIRNKEISLEDVRKQLRKRYTEAQIRGIIDMYAEAYGDSGMTADEILEEIICDSLGQMNAFAAPEREHNAGAAGIFLRQAARAAENQGARNETKNTADDGGAVKYSTVVNTDPQNHSEEKQKMIDDYVHSVDLNLRGFIEDCISGKSKIKKFLLKPVAEKAGKEIEKILGFDPSGYATVIEKRIAEHINKRHGGEGMANTSMANLNDVARMQFVIDNYDKVEYAGKSSAYVYMDEKRKNRSADTIKYQKSVDGMYYVIEAVAETKRRTVYIVSAYLQKNKAETLQSVPTKNGQPHTSENAITMESAYEYRVQQEDRKVKPKLSRVMDSEYMKAVEAGDMDEAQRMVDQAAKAAGYSVENMYHGTDAFGFTKVDTSKSDDEISFFVSDDIDVSAGYIAGNEAGNKYASVRSIGKKEVQPKKLSRNDSIETVMDRVRYLSDDYRQKIKSKVRELLSAYEFSVKSRMAAHIDELVQVGKYREFEKDLNGYHGNDIGEDGFNYYDAFFKDIDGKYYSVPISAAINNNEETVYSIGNVQKRRYNTSAGSSSKRGALKNGVVPSTNSIVYSVGESQAKNAIQEAFAKALSSKKREKTEAILSVHSSKTLIDCPVFCSNRYRAFLSYCQGSAGQPGSALHLPFCR